MDAPPIWFDLVSTAALQRHASKAKVAAVFVVIKVHFQHSLNVVRIGSKQTSEITKNQTKNNKKS